MTDAHLPVRIAPSLLAADFTRLGEEVAAIEAGGADIIHFDVMDGHFAPQITFGPGVLKALARTAQHPLDAHLMVAPADPHISQFLEAGAAMISVHPESGPHVHRTLMAIRRGGAKAGLVLNPGTPVTVVEPVLDVLDFVLIMTVNPGFGGQPFIDHQLRKIAEVRSILDRHECHHVPIEVDGGITATTIGACAAAGASIFVAGTAVFNHEADHYAKAIAHLRHAAQSGRGARAA
jgi:ribulose-phosphate 3-epimerase